MIVIEFMKISVTEDHTIEERQEIKSWVEKSQTKNQEEGDNSRTIWRVRGSPKYGLRLGKFTRQ